MENIRIATFGYDAEYSNLFAPTNALRISDFAMQLLDGLDLYYVKYPDVSLCIR
jgi:hypothetical protein